MDDKRRSVISLSARKVFPPCFFVSFCFWIFCHGDADLSPFFETSFSILPGKGLPIVYPLERRYRLRFILLVTKRQLKLNSFNEPNSSSAQRLTSKLFIFLPFPIVNIRKNRLCVLSSLPSLLDSTTHQREGISWTVSRRLYSCKGYL